MLAAVLYKHSSPLDVAKVPKVGGVTLGRNEVLIQIHACGVCHTDLHICDGDWRSHCQCSLPLTPGHEGELLLCSITLLKTDGNHYNDNIL